MGRIVTAIDTNILFYAANADVPSHRAATAFLGTRQRDPETVLSELVLIEYYCLLRNPAVLPRPLDAATAAARVHQFRRHPAWRVVDHDRSVMDEVWRIAGSKDFARRRIFDVRLALGLLAQGVTHFATRNVKDFEGLGFTEVFDPLA